MRLPRMTTRWWIMGISVATLALWPAFTVYRIYTDLNSRWMYHTWERRGVEGYHDSRITTHPAPFWPRYWRGLLGLPWPGTFTCADQCDESLNRVRRITVTITGPVPPFKWAVERDGGLEPLHPYDVLIGEHNRVTRGR
jgi:hypothetical protein